MEPGECPYCAYYKSRGARYCVRCGRDLSLGASFCPECSSESAKGARFCTFCGRYLGETRRRYQQDNRYPFLRGLVIATAIVGILVAVLTLIVCAWHMGDMLDTPERYGYILYIGLGLTDYEITVLWGNGFRAFIVIAFIVFCIFLAYAAYSFHGTAVKNGLNSAKTEHTGMAALTSCLSVSLMLSVVYFLLMALFGQETSADFSEYEVWDLYTLLFLAGFNEELAYRVVWIGIPMMVLGFLWKRDKRSLQYLMGGFGMSKAAVVLIFFSAALFGLAHNSGWGWVKILDAAFGGIIFGYLYCEYGVYACMLAHFLNDTMTITVLGTLAEWFFILAGFAILIYWLLAPNRKLLDVKGMPAMNGKLPTMREQWGRHRDM